MTSSVPSEGPIYSGKSNLFTEMEECKICLPSPVFPVYSQEIIMKKLMSQIFSATIAKEIPPQDSTSARWIRQRTVYHWASRPRLIHWVMWNNNCIAEQNFQLGGYLFWKIDTAFFTSSFYHNWSAILNFKCNWVSRFYFAFCLDFLELKVKLSSLKLYGSVMWKRDDTKIA